jgi:hypothetical protein
VGKTPPLPVQKITVQSADAMPMRISRRQVAAAAF